MLGLSVTINEVVEEVAWHAFRNASHMHTRKFRGIRTCSWRYMLPIMSPLVCTTSKSRRNGQEGCCQLQHVKCTAGASTSLRYAYARGNAAALMRWSLQLLYDSVVTLATYMPACFSVRSS